MTNIKNTLTVFQGSELTIKNKQLQKEVVKIDKAMTTASRNVWTVAQSIYNIVNGELFKEDFETLTNFSNALQVNKSLITKYCKAIEFKNLYLTNEYSYLTENQKDINRWSINKCNYILALKENSDSFMKLCHDKDIDLTKYNESGLLELLKQYKNNVIGTKTETETETETEETETEETEIKESKNFAKIKYKGDYYYIPFNVLEKYKAKKA